MAEIVTMPRLSDTMEEGVVAKWHKKVGDKIKSGDLLADIETDKATMEFESFFDGTLLYIGIKEGQKAPVDDVLAIVGKAGEDYKDLLSKSQKNNSKTQTKTENNNTEKKAANIDTSNIKANIVKMPRLSDTMEQGTVAKWHKKAGDAVKSGDLLADIETDKATMEFESFYDGVLLFQGVKEGESVPIDAVIAVIGEKGADFKTLLQAAAQNGSTQENTESAVKKETPQAAANNNLVSAAPKVASNNASFQSNGRIIASPLAKKIAAEKGINLATVKGTGDNGRIVKRDIENYKGGGVVSTFVGTESYQDEPVSQMRKTIARRLGESKFSAPHFYLTIGIDMDNAIAARKAINEVAPSKISFNDIVIKAVCSALRKHPKVNSSWLGENIRRYQYIHIGVAVAVEEGLLVPVLRFADGKTLTQINTEVKDFAQKAQNKKLQPQDMEGNTFTISNLGMFGIEEFTAIINPPDACVLAVGAIEQVPVVKNGEIVPGNRMKVTLSCDHRVVDGATGSAFLATLKQYLENPVLLLGEANI